VCERGSIKRERAREGGRGRNESESGITRERGRGRQNGRGPEMFQPEHGELFVLQLDLVDADTRASLDKTLNPKLGRLPR